MNKQLDNRYLHLVGGGGKKQRLPGLDLMRVALACLTYMFHSKVHLKCDYYFLNDFVEVGAIAMTGFFLLSGYTLFISYSDKDLTKINEIKTFYIKRSITVLPLYFFIAIVYTACSFILGVAKVNEVLVLLPVETLCLQSTFSSLFSYAHNGGTWFISCIVICYALYPFFQTVLSQISNRTKVILLLLFAGILLYAPIVQQYFALHSIYTNPFYRLLEFAIGILLAQINYSVEDNKVLNVLRNKISLLVMTLLLVLLVSLAIHYGIPTDYMLLNWIALPLFGGIILASGSISFPSLTNNKVFTYLSSISFTFFLCQVLPLWMVSQKVCTILGFDSNAIKILVSFTFCFLGAVIIHESVEKPASKMLKVKFL